MSGNSGFNTPESSREEAAAEQGRALDRMAANARHLNVPAPAPAGVRLGGANVDDPSQCSRGRITEVTCWETSDLKLFKGKESAEHHQQNIDDAKTATDVLDSGGSVADALRAVNRPVNDPILERVTKQTKLVISHWQCKDTPGYTPHYFESDFSLYVGGNVGAWSGGYGSQVELRDLVRYASDKRRPPQNLKEQPDA